MLTSLRSLGQQVVIACRMNTMAVFQIDQKTFFGIAAVSLMGYKGLEPTDPVHALPV